MKINQSDKVNILLNLLNERYDASHRMRERSLSFAVWILGFGVAIIWLLLEAKCLAFSQKVMLTVFVITISILTLYFLHSIKRGFDKNKKLMIDIERVLGCYKKGVYINSRQLFPEEYEDEKETSIRKKSSSHFVSIYIWIIIVAVMVILLIWVNPIDKNQEKGRDKITKNKIEQLENNQ